MNSKFQIKLVAKLSTLIETDGRTARESQTLFNYVQKLKKKTYLKSEKIFHYIRKALFLINSITCSRNFNILLT